MSNYDLSASSLRALRHLNTAMSRDSKALERMASGLRFNRAADNPSITQKVERYTTQSLGATTAMRNINEAISVAQTADQGLSEALGIVNDIRDTALLALNDTASTADRESFDAQMRIALQDLQRVKDTTRYNGRNLFDSGMLNFQVGSELGNSLSMEFESFSFLGVAQELLDSGGYLNSYSLGTAWLDALDGLPNTPPANFNPSNLFPEFGTETVWVDEQWSFDLDEYNDLAAAAASGDPASYTLSYLDSNGLQASTTYQLEGANFMDDFIAAVNADTATTGWSVKEAPGIVTQRFVYNPDTMSSQTVRFTTQPGSSGVANAVDLTVAAGTTIDEFVTQVNNTQGLNITAVRDESSNGIRFVSTENYLKVKTLSEGRVIEPADGERESGATYSEVPGLLFSFTGDNANGRAIEVEGIPFDSNGSLNGYGTFRRLNPNDEDQPSLAQALNLRDTAGADFVIATVDRMIDELASRRGYYGAMERRFDSALTMAEISQTEADDMTSNMIDADIVAESLVQGEAEMLVQTSLTALSQSGNQRASMVSFLLNQSLGFSGAF
jgi:flagellin-like hook-associated protein FlgL